MAALNKFRWTGELIEALLKALMEYKSYMEYKGKDFNADKPALYEAARKELAKDFPQFFGAPAVCLPSPLSATNYAVAIAIIDKEKAAIKKGYARVNEKIKEMRQKFSHAITVGSRSGPGRIVADHYDLLQMIWGGSPATVPMSFSLDTADFEQVETESVSAPDFSPPIPESALDFSLPIPTSVAALSPLIPASAAPFPPPIYASGAPFALPATLSAAPFLPSTLADSLQTPVTSRRRPRPANEDEEDDPVPILIDNKRKNLERKLNAAQRDEMMLKDIQEEKEFRQGLMGALKESNETFKQSSQMLGQMMGALVQTMNRNTERLCASSESRSSSQPGTE